MRACSYCNIYNNDIYRCDSYVTYDDLSKFIDAIDKFDK